MDDEDVSLEFTADVEEAVAAVAELARTAQELAVSAQETQSALDGVRDHATEAGAALDVYQDAAGRWRNSAGQFASSAELEAAALGRDRDEALEAAIAMRQLRDSEVEAGAAGEAAGLGGISMMAVGMTALVGLAATLAPALLAAGAGIGAFGLFAIPAIKQVIGALGDTKAQLAKLPEPVQQAVAGVKNLEGEFTKLSKAFAPEAFSLFNQALKIASDLLPKLVPLAQEGGKALQGLMGALGKGLDSKGFTDFLSMLEKLVVPATQALTRLAGTVSGIFGSALTQLAPLAVPMINMLNGLLKAAGPALAGALKLIGQVLLDVGHAITPLLGPLGKVIGFMAQHPVFAQMATVILGVVAAVKAWSIAQGILDVVLTANPVGLIIAAIALLVVAIVELVKHWHDVAAAFDAVRHEVAAIADGLWHDITSAFDKVKDAVTTAVDAVLNWVKSNWPLIVGILTGPVGLVIAELVKHWDTVRSDVTKLVSDVVNFFEQLPGKIMAAIASLPGRLVQFGRDIVQGLIHGVESMAGTLVSAIEDLIPSPIRSVVSDVLGILSPSTVFHGYGVNIVQGLVNGIRATVPVLYGTVTDMAAGVAGAGRHLAAGVAGAGLTVNPAMAASAVQAVPAVPPGSGAATVNANVTVHAQGAVGVDYSNPRYQQALQRAVQEATLRYGQINPNNGLMPTWGR